MSTISFDSRYKFMVSLGIILVFTPMFAFYELLKIDTSMLISQETMDSLEKASIQVVQTKQELYLKLLNNNLFSIMMILSIATGVFLIIYGLLQWKKFQDMEYDRAKLGIEHSQLENQNLKISITEQLRKAEEEVSNGNSDSISISSYEYIGIEELVFSKIAESLPSNYEITKNAKIGGKIYDAVAVGIDVWAKDYIFEIKYLACDITNSWYKNLLLQMKVLTQQYSESTNHIPYRQVVLITEDANYMQVHNFIANYPKTNNLNTIVLKKSEIGEYRFSL